MRSGLGAGTVTCNSGSTPRTGGKPRSTFTLPRKWSGGPVRLFNMTRSSRELRPDSGVQQVLDILARYDDQHPNAKIDAYRQNSASIRLRIIDPEFESSDRVQREELIWDILGGLPEG